MHRAHRAAHDRPPRCFFLVQRKVQAQMKSFDVFAGAAREPNIANCRAGEPLISSDAGPLLLRSFSRNNVLVSVWGLPSFRGRRRACRLPTHKSNCRVVLCAILPVTYAALRPVPAPQPSGNGLLAPRCSEPVHPGPRVKISSHLMMFASRSASSACHAPASLMATYSSPGFCVLRIVE